ncbi:hypothetical protein B0H11DRAFT_2035301 [Mycena galericulata]|nr:hypothetical protein B0H11DRAFT_2035301 [Mycena galericulata]
METRLMSWAGLRGIFISPYSNVGSESLGGQRRLQIKETADPIIQLSIEERSTRRQRNGDEYQKAIERNATRQLESLGAETKGRTRFLRVAPARRRENRSSSSAGCECVVMTSAARLSSVSIRTFESDVRLVGFSDCCSSPGTRACYAEDVLGTSNELFSSSVSSVGRQWASSFRLGSVESSSATKNLALSTAQSLNVER